MGRTAKKEVMDYKPTRPSKNNENNTVSMNDINGAFEQKSAESVADIQGLPAVAEVQKMQAVSAMPVMQMDGIGDEPLLERPKKEKNDRRVALNMPESLYVKLYNGSVKANASLNEYMLTIFREYVGK